MLHGSEYPCRNPIVDITNAAASGVVDQASMSESRVGTPSTAPMASNLAAHEDAPLRRIGSTKSRCAAGTPITPKKDQPMYGMRYLKVAKRFGGRRAFPTSAKHPPQIASDNVGVSTYDTPAGNLPQETINMFLPLTP